MWWVRTDCCGVFCAIFTVLLMFFAAFVQTYYVIGPWKGYFSIHLTLYLLLVIISAICHTKCQFSNPGCVPKTIEQDSSLIKTSAGERPRICRSCSRLKPYDAHHCSSCQRCILRMDHHCPWVNNCVAMFNQKYFLQFLLYTGCQCLFCLVSLSSRFFYCSKLPYNYNNDNINITNNNNPSCNPTPIDVLLCVLNFIEGILFGLFTFIMLFDQLSAIFSNTPYIDQIKGKKGAKKQKYQCLIDVFGEALSISWFFPTPLTKQMKQNWIAMSNHYG